MNSPANPLDLTAAWPVDNVSAAIVRAGEVVATVGDVDRRFRLASLTKPVVAWSMLVAIEEGIVELDQPVGQPGCTLRHLLAHAGGYPFDGPEAIAVPERTRIYSNTGIEVAAAAIESASAMSIADYLTDAVLTPLSMNDTELVGSPAHGLHGTVADLTRFVQEVRRPSLIDPATRDEALRIHYPGLSGIVPGVGRYERCPWGLGFEIRGDKSPHWTGTRNSPGTVGHFGGAGTMFWLDSDADVALIALTDRPFDQWADTALSSWTELSDAVLASRGSAPEAQSHGAPSP